MTVSTASRRYAMVLLAIVYMFNFIDRQILAILLPAIRDEFQVGDTILGLLAGTAFALFYITLGVPIAQIADRVNRRNLIALAVAVWSGMTALSGFAGNIWHLTLARIGVGIGEAGCSPPAHSIISDLYPPERRSAAMGFYTIGISTGIMVAYMAGGWVVQNIGWREAFFIVGIPGILLAAIVRYTMVEPRRGAVENLQETGEKPTLGDVLGFLSARRSFWHMGIAAGLTAFVGYSVITFMPSFLDRSFDMGRAEVGFWLGIIIGPAVGAGFFGGGYVADRLAVGGRRRSFNFLALTMLLTMVFYFVMYLGQSAAFCLAVFVLPSLVSNAYLPTVFAQVQGLVPLRMRAVASALTLLIINAIGLALGPFLTGALSDVLEPTLGDESIRYSLLIVCALVLPWAAWHYVLAGRTIDSDLARSEGA